MKTKVSVIVPIYNSESYIDKCIQSIINQTIKDIEIILVDDGSTDKSIEIINKYAEKDKRITAIKQKNEGISSARNYGISVATGDFITFVDSDDFIEKDMLESLYNTAIDNNCDVIFSGIKIVNGSNDIKYKFNGNSKVYKKEEVFKLFYFDKEPFSPNYATGKLIKNNICNKVKFREDIFLMEDTLFSVELFMNCSNNIMYIDRHLYNYVQRIGSESKHFSKKRITSFYALEEVLNLAKSIDEKYEKSFLKVYSKLILSILQDIISFDFENNKREYFNISRTLNKHYVDNMKSKDISYKNKIHLSIIRISPSLYKTSLNLIK